MGVGVGFRRRAVGLREACHGGQNCTHMAASRRCATLRQVVASQTVAILKEADAGRTAIVGVVSDQSHLFGILERIRSLGLELVRVETLCR